MTDRLNNDLAALLTPPPSHGVQFSQGVILSWDNENLHNTVEWRGITLTDVPIIEGVNALVIKPGDVVGMLGWAPENAKGVGSWWILGKLSNPGEFVADLNITAKLIQFLTESGELLAFFGKESDGDPTWILYYGGRDEQAALRIVNGEYVAMYDRNGHEIVSSDGATGFGLARPWIPLHIVPSFSAQGVGEGSASLWPSTSSTSFVEMLKGVNVLWHPRISVGVDTAVTGGTAEWQFRINGTVVHTATGSDNTTVTVPGWGTTNGPGGVTTLQVYGRCTGGATRAWFICDRLYGRQS